MNSLIIAATAFLLYIVAYNTYGRFLARKIFRIDPDAKCPSKTHYDGIDFVATNKTLLFGHPFTSIAGTGPIVGPAIAIIWGWLHNHMGHEHQSRKFLRAAKMAAVRHWLLDHHSTGMDGG